jgi:protocatechuate 3,4-dioxygenase beta subunit
VTLRLTRREALALLGASGAALVAGALPRGARGARALGAVPACVVRPEQTEGPYFVDGGIERSDIRTDPASGAASAGVPLALAFEVSRIANGACAPLAGARVDVWHCDALGVYSDVRDPGFDSSGRGELRGWQRTDAAGLARVATVYPGWYPGRAVHVHFKIRTQGAESRGHAFTSQLYFDDALTDRVHAQAPYAERRGRRTPNARDGIFRDGGDRLLLAPAADGAGYAASFAIALQLD